MFEREDPCILVVAWCILNSPFLHVFLEVSHTFLAGTFDDFCSAKDLRGGKTSTPKVVPSV